ncbi:MAG: hypothetical protein HUU37_00450 [Bdellovibrionales bacterium]|nr:hypothetical protein [Bdellovibrionales bacterium]
MRRINSIALTLSAFVALAFVACGNKEEGGTPASQPPAPTPVTSADGEASKGEVSLGSAQVSFEVQRDEIPSLLASDRTPPRNANHLTVVFRWKGSPNLVAKALHFPSLDAPGVPLELNIDSRDGQNELRHYFRPQGARSFEPLWLRYQFLSPAGETTEILIREKRDLWIEGEMDLRHIDGVQTKNTLRVFGFGPRAQLLVGGASFHVEADYLLAAPGANLRTFSERELKEPVLPFRHGLDGAPISIHAQKARGNLAVTLIGGKGADGLPGADVVAGLVPPKAAKGSDGQVSGRAMRVPGGGCRGGDCPGPDVVDARTCVAPAGHGAPGAQGFPGGNGEPGHRGGRSGSLLMKISEPEGLFRWQVEVLPGQGGVGGEGGKGGEGGEGGDPGAAPEPCNPRDARPGSRGQAGPKGKAGAPGTAGEREKICVTNRDEGCDSPLEGTL